MYFKMSITKYFFCNVLLKKKKQLSNPDIISQDMSTESGSIKCIGINKDILVK